MIDIVEICTKVLERLSKMDYEKSGGNSPEQLIFPLKRQAKGTDIKDRISEQELRLLFIEEFKGTYYKLYYSIETPTEKKYILGKSYKTFISQKDGQSALIDMCILERNSNKYNRILNIEFKHKNSPIESIGKDILKLINDEPNAAFIQLLYNTNSGTLCNKKETGVFNKLFKSFNDFQKYWSNNEKSIQLIIISLKEKTLIHRKIQKTDLNCLKDIFFIEMDCVNISEIEANGWTKEVVK